MDGAVHHLRTVGEMLAPTPSKKDAFGRMVETMIAADRTELEIIHMLIGMLSDGVRAGNWTTVRDVEHIVKPLLSKPQATPPCTCACASGGFCGGCGHAGCGGR